MPATAHEGVLLLRNYLSSMGRALRRRLRLPVVYLLLGLLVFSFLTVQYSLGRPSDTEPQADADEQLDSEERPRPPVHMANPQPHFRPVHEQQPLRGDVVPPRASPLEGAGSVPERRIVHLDLKGAAYKPSFFPQLFDYFVKMKFTGILIEWEDMFPYTGKLAEALNGDAYSVTDVHFILKEASSRKLEIIPLVQTFAHLEWILKLEAFAHMREDPKYPQVICFGAPASFDLIKDMVDQVAAVHKQYGMPFFHMGADEVFQLGVCNESVSKMRELGGKDRALLWHMARVAKYVKETHSTVVLAWNDMFSHISEEDLRAFQLTSLLEPVLWSYAEDLDVYLPFGTWLSLKPFGNVWGASVFKGADGPARYISNPMHYVRNHESWITQFKRAQPEFRQIRGLFYCGWSRYDHLAVIAELVPTAFPQLAMCAETMLGGRPLKGAYPQTRQWLGCDPPTTLGGYATGCQFPGAKIYEILNEFASRKAEVTKYLDEDFEFTGWVSRVAQDYNVSSPMYTEKVLTQLSYNYQSLKELERRFRAAMEPIYFAETIDEYVFTYMSEVLERMERRIQTARRIPERKTFPKRPYVKYPAKREL